MSHVQVENTPQARHVLMVEDEPGTAELMRRTLTRSGYCVDVASGVNAGLRALNGNESIEYMALLLDYHLPDGEPWQLADAAQARVPEVPVIFVTAMSHEGVAIEAVRRGFADYVKKTDGFWNELPAVLERVARLNQIKGRLDETSALMRAIVENSSDLVAVCSGDGKLVYLSPVCNTLLGRTTEELQDRPWTDLVAEEDRDVLLGQFSTLERSPGEPVTIRCPRKTGQHAWVEARVALLKAHSAAPPMIVLTFHDVTEQREHEERMEASLREKEVLVREIYHRVKNNLQVIQSLLKMRARSLPKDETRAAIESTVQRVHAMALVHERLYKMEDLSRISLSEYLCDLFGGILESSSKQPGQVTFDMNVEEIPLTLDKAIPFGLLANELISNSLKHGFPDGRTGKVAISIARDNGCVQMTVQDDGIGLPVDFGGREQRSMGLILASSLAMQLGGSLEFSSSGGCRVQACLTRL